MHRVGQDGRSPSHLRPFSRNLYVVVSQNWSNGIERGSNGGEALNSGSPAKGEYDPNGATTWCMNELRGPFGRLRNDHDPPVKSGVITAAVAHICGGNVAN
jgi:hypothetical protein